MYHWIFFKGINDLKEKFRRFSVMRRLFYPNILVLLNKKSQEGIAVFVFVAVSSPNK
jgi:hypothetical protein